MEHGERSKAGFMWSLMQKEQLGLCLMELQPLENLEWQPKAGRARAGVLQAEAQEQNGGKSPRNRVPVRLLERPFLEMQM